MSNSWISQRQHSALRWPALLGVVAVMLTSACSDDDEPDARPSTPAATPTTTAEETPTTTPTEESPEDQALEAASTAIADYQRVADQLYADLDSDLAQLDEVAYGPALQTLRSSIEEARAESRRRTGESAVSGFELITSDLSPEQPESGVAYPLITVMACRDQSGTDTLDASGNSVTSADRPDEYLTQYQLIDLGFPSDTQRWLVMSETPQVTQGQSPEAVPCP